MKEWNYDLAFLSIMFSYCADSLSTGKRFHLNIYNCGLLRSAFSTTKISFKILLVLTELNIVKAEYCSSSNSNPELYFSNFSKAAEELRYVWTAVRDEKNINGSRFSLEVNLIKYVKAVSQALVTVSHRIMTLGDYFFKIPKGEAPIRGRAII